MGAYHGGATCTLGEREERGFEEPDGAGRWCNPPCASRFATLKADDDYASRAFFSPSDQARFAALSGDFNPIHVDEVAARRTVIGAPVVHGVHLLCWALETWIGRKKPGKCALESLTVAFHRGALLGETLSLSVPRDDEFLLRIQRPDQAEMMAARGKLGQSFVYVDALPPIIPTDCRALSPADSRTSYRKLTADV
jgi:acyl dehydratase